MIVSLRDLVAVIERDPKPWLAPGYSRNTFFRAKAGQQITMEMARALLQRACTLEPQVGGVQLANGTVVLVPEATVLADIARLDAEVRALRAQVALLSSRRFRELVNEGRSRLDGHQHRSLD